VQLFPVLLLAALHRVGDPKPVPVRPETQKRIANGQTAAQDKEDSQVSPSEDETHSTHEKQKNSLEADATGKHQSGKQQKAVSDAIENQWEHHFSMDLTCGQR
jgi:hypothetical protein